MGELPSSPRRHTLRPHEFCGASIELEQVGLDSAEFVEPINPEVGTWYFNSDGFSWQGDFAPGESRVLSFTSRIRDCVNSADTSSALNDGNPIAIRSLCGNVRGTSNALPPVALLHPLSVALGAAPVPGSISPVVNGSQIIDPAAPLTIDVTITNALGTSHPNAVFSFEIPPALIVADPPFTAQPPAGLTYDALSRLVFFSGEIPPSGLAFSIAAQPDPTGPCASVITMTGGSSESCSDLAATLRLYAFGGSASPNSMLFLADGSTLYSWDPVFEAAPRRMGCLPGNARSFDRAPDGRLFFTGTVDFMFDPATLAVTELSPIILPQIGPEAVGFFFFNDLVWDSYANKLYLLAMNYSLGRGSIVQFDPATNAANLVITRNDFAYRYKIEVDALGRPLVPISEGARRVDPTQPLPLNSAQAQFILPAFPQYGFPLGPQSAQGLAYVGTPDGGLITLSAAYWTQVLSGQTLNWQLFSLARANPADTFTVVEPQLAWRGSAFPAPLPPRPLQFTPVIEPAVLSATRLLDADQNRVLLIDHSTDFATTTATGRLIDLSSGTNVTTLFPTTVLPFAVRDVIWIKGPATCPADWDGINGVDGDDVIAFFAEWDVSNADFNGDGGTDGDDVIDFFAHWDAGC